jgi:hypothetical protein
MKNLHTTDEPLAWRSGYFTRMVTALVSLLGTGRADGHKAEQ